MQAKSRKFWMGICYAAAGFCTLAGFIYIGTEMVEQHSIFAELRAVRTGGEEAENAAKLLIDRKHEGILYSIQEIRQDAETYPYYVLATVFQKAAGRKREALSEQEKAAVRGLIEKARYKVVDYCDGRTATFNETEQAMLGLTLRILEKLDADSRAEFMQKCSISDTYKAERSPRHQGDCRRYTCFIRVFRQIIAGEPVAKEDAAFVRTEFDNVLERFDFCITGDAFDLYPEEKSLFRKAAVYAVQSGVEDSPGGAGSSGEMLELKDEFLQKVQQDGSLTCLESTDQAGKFLPFVQHFNREDLRDLKYAAAGLEKMAGMYEASLTSRECGRLEQLLQNADSQALPVDLLREWIQVSRARGGSSLSRSFTPVEKQVMLNLSEQYMAEYEASVERFAAVVLRSVQQLRESEERFIPYEHAEDEQKRSEAGAFSIIRALWRKGDDKVIMIDLIDICGTQIESVRRLMEQALLAVGRPAVDSLIRQVRREKIDQALAVKTEFRTRAERLRDLNEENKIVRLSCMRVLGGILRQEIDPDIRARIRSALLPCTDDEDPDINCAARLALHDDQ